MVFDEQRRPGRLAGAPRDRPHRSTGTTPTRAILGVLGWSAASQERSGGTDGSPGPRPYVQWRVANESGPVGRRWWRASGLDGLQAGQAVDVVGGEHLAGRRQ